MYAQKKNIDFEGPDMGDIKIGSWEAPVSSQASYLSKEREGKV